MRLTKRTHIKREYVIGMDVGATHTKVAILNLYGRVLAKDSFLTQLYKKDDLIKTISTSVKRLIKEKRFRNSNIWGLGVGVPGLVDFKKGLVFYFVNIKGWKNVPLKEILERSIGLPVFVDNDVKVMAVGEMTYGAGRGYKDVICLTLGTGVGGAVIVDGNLYRGCSLVAGEIGHVPINEKGPLCNCGNSGCLEAYVGREYFLRDVREELKDNARSIISKMVKRLSDITPELIAEAARKGDAFARRKWSQMGEHIGNALVGVVNLLNPELIVIGGGIAEAGELIFEPIRKTLKKRAMKVQKDAVKVVKAKLGNDAGVIGASELVKSLFRS